MRTIETEIIPRLLLAHLSEPAESAPAVQPKVTPVDVTDFTRLVLEREVDAAIEHIQTMCDRGLTLDVIFLNLLAPTARLLGDMWRDDLCSFTDVTIGLSRMQRVLRELGPRFESEAAGDLRGRILLAAAPGEQHSFGLSMLESFFRRAGWEVWGGTGHLRTELMRILRAEWIDVIGLSLSSDLLYAELRDLICDLRRVSRNSNPLVMVGGNYFFDHPEHATQIGADFAAVDAPDALRRADICLGNRHKRC